MNFTDQIASARASLALAREEIVLELASERGRRRAVLTRQMHEIQRMLNISDPYASQAGQDRVIDRLLREKNSGVFLDVGGYDGVTGSNSLFFEMHRGWKGALIEPVSAFLDKARIARRCECYRYAVASQKGEAEFLSVTSGYTQMGGLKDSYDTDLLKKVRQNPNHKEETLMVPTRTLADLIEETGQGLPDFISLDIEGGEMAVLQQFDFDAYPVPIWTIENNAADSDLPTLMKKNGYDLVEFCGPDEIYRKNKDNIKNFRG